MSFDYFYGQQSDLFTFYRVPKVLFTNERFWNISADAKMLYGILLDRMSLSAKNGWIDKNGRVYIIFTIDEAKMALNCAEQKAIKDVTWLPIGKILHRSIVDKPLTREQISIGALDQSIAHEIKELGFAKGATYINPKTGKKVQRFVDFNQGLDAFLLTPHKAKRLGELAIRPARIAFDHIEDAEAYKKAIRLCAQSGITHMSNYLLYNGVDFTGK